MPHSYNPNRLLDTLSARLGAESDRMLSRMLRLSLPLIDGIRAGRVALRASLLSAMAERAGTSIDGLRRIPGDRRSKARMSCSVRAA